MIYNERKGAGMKITANLYATYRAIAGGKTIVVDLPDKADILQAVQELVQKEPKLRPHWLNAEGALTQHLLVFVNGADVTTLPDQWKTKLEEGDVVDFIPPVAGG